MSGRNPASAQTGRQINATETDRQINRLLVIRQAVGYEMPADEATAFRQALYDLLGLDLKASTAEVEVSDKLASEGDPGLD